MARLFAGERELKFFSDITKELVKDIAGQKVYLYRISELKTVAHEVYDEAVNKIFDHPIALDAIVDASFHEGTKVDAFGIDQQYKLEFFVQYRDLVHKGIEISVGDVASFSTIFYEVSNVTIVKNIFGLAEHKQGVKVAGVRIRDSQFKAKLIGPTDIKYTDEDAVQKTFVQQRGLAENSEGPTGDTREMVTDGTLEVPLSGQREVSERGSLAGDSNNGSSFYGEEE